MLYQLGREIPPHFRGLTTANNQSEPPQDLPGDITVLSLFLHRWTLPRDAAECVALNFLGDMISI